MTIRGRLAVGLAVAVAVTVGGTLADRLVGARPAGTPSPPDAVTGAWFCPHGGGKGWHAWLVIANPGAGSAVVRVSSQTATSDARITQQSLPPGTERYVEVPAEEPASGGTVEYFGAPVAAGMVMAPPHGGLAAEPCAPGTGTTWFLPEGTGARGHRTRLEVLNPFAREAVLDITLVLGDRVLKPGPLKGVVLPANRAADFDLNRFGLGEEPLSAEVRVPLGKVAAATLVETEGGVRSSLGISVPSRAWILPGGDDEGLSDVVVQAPPGAEAPFSIRALGAESQVSSLDNASVEGARAGTFEVEAADAGLVAGAAGPAPFVAGRRTTEAIEEGTPSGGESRKRGKGANERGTGKKEGTGTEKRGRSRAARPRKPDLGSTTGAPTGARRWVALPAVGPDGGRSTLILENPGRDQVKAQIRRIGEDGPEALDPVDVPGGRTIAVTLAGTEPVAVLVVASGPLVPAQVGTSDQGYAVVVGSRV